MTDMINHPPHYAVGWSNGAEVIDITENLNFNLGNCVKYVARAGKKDPAKELEDLKKAQWYLTREIGRLSTHEPIKRQPRVLLELNEDCRDSEWVRNRTGSTYRYNEGWEFLNYSYPDDKWVRCGAGTFSPGINHMDTFTEVIE